MASLRSLCAIAKDFSCILNIRNQHHTLNAPSMRSVYRGTRSPIIVLVSLRLDDGPDGCSDPEQLVAAEPAIVVAFI